MQCNISKPNIVVPINVQPMGHKKPIKKQYSYKKIRLINYYEIATILTRSRASTKIKHSINNNYTK